MVSGEDVPKKTNPKVWWLLFDHLGSGPNSWWVCLGTSIWTILPMCLCCLLWLETSCNLIWHNFIYPCMRNKSHYMYQEIDAWTSEEHFMTPSPTKNSLTNHCRAPGARPCRDLRGGERRVLARAERLSLRAVRKDRGRHARSWRLGMETPEFLWPPSYKLVINPVYYSYIIIIYIYIYLL